MPKATILQNSEGFDEIRPALQEFQYHNFQLAGRIIRSETTPTGVIFLAEWLPFPDDTFAGPEAKSTGLSFGRFSMHFPGTVDHDGQRKGNEFLMAGTLTPVPESVDHQKIPTPILHFLVQCLHIWKTAGDGLAAYIVYMDGSCRGQLPTPVRRHLLCPSDPILNPVIPIMVSDTLNEDGLGIFICHTVGPN